MTSRSFHLGDILTVATGSLVSPRHMDAVYDLCNFMTGDNLYTHQLPRAAQECQAEIYRQHPDLRDVVVPDFSTVPRDRVDRAVSDWLAEQVARFGEYRDVVPLAAGDHTRIDPLAELAMRFPKKPVIVVTPHEGGAACS